MLAILHTKRLFCRSELCSRYFRSNVSSVGASCARDTYLTLTTLHKKPILATPKTADIIFQSFDWLETNDRLRWFCICVMPDHIHTVIQLGSKQTLSRLIQSFKSHTAKQMNACLDRSSSLWQPAYHDHGIRRDESLNAIIEYCYQNPVRAGLVKAARDYLFWRCKYEME